MPVLMPPCRHFGADLGGGGAAGGDDGEAQRGDPALPAAGRGRRGAAGAPRWAVVGQAGRGRLVDPQGRARRGRGPAGGRPARVRGGDGQRPPAEGLVALGEVRQRGGKVVSAWAAPGDLDLDAITSNTFTLEWPPRSGVWRSSPRSTGPVARPATAWEKLLAAQAELVDRLLAALAGG